MPDLQSRPFRPAPDKCCERCVFGRGDHAHWCKRSAVSIVVDADGNIFETRSIYIPVTGTRGTIRYMNGVALREGLDVLPLGISRTGV